LTVSPEFLVTAYLLSILRSDLYSFTQLYRISNTTSMLITLTTSAKKETKHGWHVGSVITEFNLFNLIYF
jgi:hypothetical protein